MYIFRNGAKYTGYYDHGLKNGDGLLEYPDGSKYEGKIAFIKLDWYKSFLQAKVRKVKVSLFDKDKINPIHNLKKKLKTS